MYVKSSPPQLDAVAVALTASFLVLGQALYHWATLPPSLAIILIIIIVIHIIVIFISIYFAGSNTSANTATYVNSVHC